MNTDLDPRLLRTFCAVVDELHFRRAAARLHATQSSVSQQVRELERRVGVELLRRNQRSVELTEAGRVLHQDARDILAKAEASILRARDAARGLRGTLTFGLIGAATFEAMPMLMAEMARVAPDVRFRFREMTAKEQVAALQDGSIDAGMVRAGVRAAGLELMTVLTEPIVCLLPESHWLAERETVSIEELEGEPILNLARAYDPAAHDFYLGVYRSAGFEPNVVHEVSQIATILFVIATSRCVALGPAGWHVLRRKGVIVRKLSPPAPQVSTCLIWNPLRVGRTLSVALEAASNLGGGSPRPTLRRR